MLKLSIITINLNNVTGLRKTIESVVSQTFTDYEYIIIDGGSTDGSVDVIKEFVDKITYWVSELDKGIYQAMNKGILRASGEYCLFLNSGDWLIENKVLNEAFIRSNDEDLLYCDSITERGPKTQPDNLTLYKFIYGSLSHPATFIKRKLFNTVGLYNEQNYIVSDWEFFLKLIIYYDFTYRHLPVFLSYHDKNGISSSPTHSSILTKERLDVLKRNLSSFILDDYERLKQYDRSKIIQCIVRFKETSLYKIILNSIIKFRQ